MTWNLTLFFIHVFAAWGFGKLFCTAPDRLQKTILLLFILASLVLVSYYAAALFDHDPPWQIKVIGYSVEHLAVLLYLFRLTFIEHLTCKKSSQASPPCPV